MLSIFDPRLCHIRAPITALSPKAARPLLLYIRQCSVPTSVSSGKLAWKQLKFDSLQQCYIRKCTSSTVLFLRFILTGSALSDFSVIRNIQGREDFISDADYAASLSYAKNTYLRLRSTFNPTFPGLRGDRGWPFVEECVLPIHIDHNAAAQFTLNWPASVNPSLNVQASMAPETWLPERDSFKLQGPTGNICGLSMTSL